jgi:hypothetical protein
MALVWAARIALYVQLLLGFDRWTRMEPGIMQELHYGVGILAAILCLIAFRPVPGLTNPGPRVAARFMAFGPLALGLYFRYVGPIYTPLLIAHVILAFLTVAFVEIAAARQRRGMVARTDPAPPSG